MILTAGLLTLLRLSVSRGAAPLPEGIRELSGQTISRISLVARRIFHGLRDIRVFPALLNEVCVSVCNVCVFGLFIMHYISDIKNECRPFISLEISCRERMLCKSDATQRCYYGTFFQ